VREIEVVKEVQVPIDRPVEIIREVEVVRDVQVSADCPTVREIEVVKEVQVPVDRPVEIIREVEVVREVQVPVEIERVAGSASAIVEIVKEIPYAVETIREISVPTEIIRETEVVRELVSDNPVEIFKEIEVIKEVPFKVVEETEIIRETESEKPVVILREIEKIVRVPYEVFREVEILREIETVKTVEVLKEIQIEVIKEVPVEIYREVPYFIERTVEKPVYIEVPTAEYAAPSLQAAEAIALGGNSATALYEGYGETRFAAADGYAAPRTSVAVSDIGNSYISDGLRGTDENMAPRIPVVDISNDKNSYAPDGLREEERLYARDRGAAALRADGAAVTSGRLPSEEQRGVQTDYAISNEEYREYFSDILAAAQSSSDEEYDDAEKRATEASQTDLNMRLYTSGFRMKTYVKSQTRDYLESAFILKYKLWRDCGFCMMLFLISELGLFWGLSGAGSSELYLPLMCVSALFYVIPLVMWLFNSGKRARAEYNFKTSLLLRAILYIEGAIAIVFIAFYAIGVNVERISSLYLTLFLPLALLAVIPVGAPIRLILGKLKRYSVRYGK
jgi:hypothetical protein